MELSSESKSTRRVYTVGHLEAGQGVDLIAIVSGEAVAGWTVHGHNGDGDVEFVNRDFINIKEDQSHVEPFLRYLLFLLVVPPIVGAIPFGYLAATGVGLILFILLTLHVGPAIRVFAQVVTEFGKSRAPVTTLSISGEAQPRLVVADSIEGSQISFEAAGVTPSS